MHKRFPSLKDVKAWAEAQRQAHTAENFKPNSAIRWQHRDGSHGEFHSAFALERDGFYVIFTEHHGQLILEKDLSTVEAMELSELD
jgi:hypothetical protein